MNLLRSTNTTSSAELNRNPITSPSKGKFLQRLHHRISKSRRSVATVQSLGIGSFSTEGVQFKSTLHHEEPIISYTDNVKLDLQQHHPQQQQQSNVVDPNTAYFLRVTDLDLATKREDDDTSSTIGTFPDYLSDSEDENSFSSRNSHQQKGQTKLVGTQGYSSTQPPPGMVHDASQQWIMFDATSINDDSHGTNLPLLSIPMPLQAAVQQLNQHAVSMAFNNDLWTPADSRTKQLKQLGDESFYHHGSLSMAARNSLDKDALIWKSNIIGNNVPAIRSAGIIQMSPEQLTDLLLNSGRVQEYNKFSLGRTDMTVYDESLLQFLQSSKHQNIATPNDGRPSVTKIVKSRSKPPMISTPIEMETLLHATQLKDGYMIVSRSIHRANATPSGCEVLFGACIIQRIEGMEDVCLMINVNQMTSTLVPQMIAKRIGLTAASNFMNSIRSVPKK